jgi:hypothetical protein
MRTFDYPKLADYTWDTETVNLLSKIHECKGRQDFSMPAACLSFLSGIFRMIMGSGMADNHLCFFYTIVDYSAQ